MIPSSILIPGSIIRFPPRLPAHPMVNNLEAVKFEYASPIDTLANASQKNCFALHISTNCSWKDFRGK